MGGSVISDLIAKGVRQSGLCFQLFTVILTPTDNLQLPSLLNLPMERYVFVSEAV